MITTLIFVYILFFITYLCQLLRKQVMQVNLNPWFSVIVKVEFLKNFHIASRVLRMYLNVEKPD